MRAGLGLGWGWKRNQRCPVTPAARWERRLVEVPIQLGLLLSSRVLSPPCPSPPHGGAPGPPDTPNPSPGTHAAGPGTTHSRRPLWPTGPRDTLPCAPCRPARRGLRAGAPLCSSQTSPEGGGRGCQQLPHPASSHREATPAAACVRPRGGACSWEPRRRAQGGCRGRPGQQGSCSGAAWGRLPLSTSERPGDSKQSSVRGTKRSKGRSQ